YTDGNAIFNTLQQFAGAVATALAATVINQAQRHATDFQQGTIFGSQLVLGSLLLLLLLVLLLVTVQFHKHPR
ncbi:MAG TPA: MFS transporter, partial [Candidatus Enterococcus stercoravium]|nr:MFS transporter [Candidatus Enterococcus stercoravium]